jgi:hypothetical protein
MVSFSKKQSHYVLSKVNFHLAFPILSLLLMEITLSINHIEQQMDLF